MNSKPLSIVIGIYQHIYQFREICPPWENAVFWVVTPYGSCKNRRFSGTYHLYDPGWISVIVTACIVPNSLNLSTLMMETIRSADASVLIRATRNHIPEDGILHRHPLENPKSYICPPYNLKVLLRISWELINLQNLMEEDLCRMCGAVIQSRTHMDMASWCSSSLDKGISRGAQRN
jgi:hypothetical protein